MAVEHQRDREEILEPLDGPVIRRVARYDLLTVDDIKVLTAFHSDAYPVVSVYLDARPEERQREKLRVKLKHLIDEAKRLPATRSKQRGKMFQHEAERLMTWFETEYDHTGRGLAIFTATEPALWRSFRLPVPVRDRLVMADRPYLRPLLTLVDEFERYLVLLVDKQAARLFVVYLGEIEEYTELIDELVPRPREGGLSAEKNQRHHDMHVLWHVKHAVDATEKLWMRERCQWLLIGGTDEPLAEVRRHLPKALRERVAWGDHRFAERQHRRHPGAGAGGGAGYRAPRGSRTRLGLVRWRLRERDRCPGAGRHARSRRRATGVDPGHRGRLPSAGLRMPELPVLGRDRNGTLPTL